MITIIDSEGREIEVITVEATAALASTNAFGIEHSGNTAEIIQAAMVAAAELAHSKGITDPDKIKKYMLTARQEVKQKLGMPQNPLE